MMQSYCSLIPIYEICTQNLERQKTVRFKQATRRFYFNKTNEKFIRKFKITNDFVGLRPDSYLLDQDGDVEIFKEARGNKIFYKRLHSA